MGRVNPFFERAGFTRIGTIRNRKTTRKAGESHAFSEPVYYVRENQNVRMPANTK